MLIFISIKHIMMSIRKYQEKKEHPHPHIGALVRKAMVKKSVSQAELARRMGLKSTAIAIYLKRSSLQFGILWDLGIALKHDFLLEIANSYPAGFPLNERSTLLQELNEKTLKIIDLEKEVVIYKNALSIAR